MKRERCRNFLQDSSGEGEMCNALVVSMYVYDSQKNNNKKIGTYCPQCENMEPLK